ncbi:hypothetical protein M433DRAFT_2074 [Acidomyces richmondensis BFW]|nr:MAG: hypothetical protein FE78DRAFT_27390 [Acidomyces sp. 'richmondensis']KYG48374.1 hypothetical protein M433DRAFT_2074 [Acidomyces richmondensis BFW]
MATDIPKKMKAIQITEYRKPYELRDAEVPFDLAPVDMLVKVAVASHCHTDSMVQNGVFGTKLPVTASHEGSGTVVALGLEAERLGFKVGSRVMCGIPYHACGKCVECKGPENQTQYCRNVEGMLGVYTHGFLADYAKVDARFTTLLPNEVKFESAAPLACAGRTIWRGVLQTGLEKGEWVALVGSGGGLGHLGIQFAKALGLKVIGIDARDDGLDLSKKIGADVVADARKGKDEVVKEVEKVTDGRRADSTICVSDAQSAAGLACAVTKMHGTVVQIAQPDNIEVPFQEIVFRDVRIHGSLVCSAEESKSMLNTVAKHGISVKTNPFHGLESIGNLVEMVHSGKIQGKAIIIVDKEQIEQEKKIGAKY